MPKLRITKKSEYDQKLIISLDNEIWGILPARILLSLYPETQEAEIRDMEAEALKALIREYAANALLDYLAKQEHSEKQALEFLARRKIHPSITEPIIAQALKQKYIDDSRFTELLIRSLASRNKSKRHTLGKLREHSIPETIYQPFIEEYYSPEEELALLKTELGKLQVRYSKLPDYQARDKIIAALYRKGFPLDQILSLL